MTVTTDTMVLVRVLHRSAAERYLPGEEDRSEVLDLEGGIPIKESDHYFSITIDDIGRTFMFKRADGWRLLPRSAFKSNGKLCGTHLYYFTRKHEYHPAGKMLLVRHFVLHDTHLDQPIDFEGFHCVFFSKEHWWAIPIELDYDGETITTLRDESIKFD